MLTRRAVNAHIHHRETNMPVITYNTVEGVLSNEMKKELTQALTEAVSQVMGEKIKKNAWVIINESPEANFSIGGHAVTAAGLKSLMA